MRTAICMNVRNEARGIAEWMAFHKEAGFDTQIIFDNASTDGTRQLIQAAARLFDVRYHHWGAGEPHLSDRRLFHRLPSLPARFRLARVHRF